jgi:pimeloyl-ACP methyl ester carboxylesterase
MAHFILVPGAFHGGWCWERIVPLLEAEGHVVEAPDLPGTQGMAPLTGDVLGAWARFVADLAADAEEPVVLVGHSRGGIVISEAADLIPETVARLVYVTAMLLPAGASIQGERTFGDATDIEADQLMEPLPEAAALPGFYHLCAPEDARAALDRLAAEPAQPLSQPLRLSEARYGRIPRVYIEAAEDRAIGIDQQRAMHGAVPCELVITLPSDHSPFYSTPEKLAAALLALA